MEILVGALVIGVVLYFFGGSRKMARWNDDPRQQELAQLLITAAQNGSEYEVTNFL
jgi:hypothetical protein